LAKKETEFKPTIVRNVYPERLPTHYVSGAFGGLRGTYHFNIDFFVDVLPKKDFNERVELLQSGNVTVIREEEDRPEVFREVKTRLLMTPQAAKELADWIHRTLNAGAKAAEKPGGQMYV
jgi:hypothetical protein